MKITRLFIYPVKSLAGIEISSSKVLEKGLEFDRRWMVVDSDNQFLTQREHPNMALIRTSVSQAVLKMSSAKGSVLVQPNFRESEVTVWNDSFFARECNPEVNEWLTKR